MTDVARQTRGEDVALTKAEGLGGVTGRLVHASVPPFCCFTVDDWRRRRSRVLTALLRQVRTPRLAVRSSTRSEDDAAGTLAGHYLTVLDVRREVAAIARAVDAVAASYDGGGDEQILVQEMVQDVVRSGVIVTRDPATGAAYEIVELWSGPTTDVVTAGRALPTRIAVHADASPEQIRNAGLAAVLAATREVRALTPSAAPLDIELAETAGGRVEVLQVRALTALPAQQAERDHALSRRLRALAATMERVGRPQRSLAGCTTVLGLMPDWNPAELIGPHPHPLAASLFRALISDAVWREARAALGYRALPGVRLLHFLAGRPYIDVRASLNSFLPVGLLRRTATALVDAWLDRLRRHPELHDRIEFDVAHTALDCSTRRTYVERYGSRLLSPDAFADWETRLRALTARAIAERGGLGIEPLVTRAGTVASQRLTSAAPRDVLRLLAACRSDGAWPFAVVARYAFMAEGFLRSLVTRGAWSPHRVRGFRRALATVAGTVARDWYAANRDPARRPRFLEDYGHLRPGSFDVTSLPYALRGEALWTDAPSIPPLDAELFHPTAHERHALDRLLAEARLDICATALLRWIRTAIIGRERAKFFFMRRVSEILELLVTWGRQVDLARDQLAWLTIEDFRKARTACELAVRADTARNLSARDRSVRMSHLLRSPADLYVVPDLPTVPTFVTTRAVVAPPVCLDDPGTIPSAQLGGRIVCLERADPGYDWILGCGIAGLVTRFGGANSHVAIRCFELDVPAAIGTGDDVFRALATAPRIELRCAERIVRPV